MVMPQGVRVVFQLFVIQREQEQEIELAPGNTNWFATLVQENTSILGI